MGIIFHRKSHGGRRDDPHGVTAPPPIPAAPITISSEPPAATKASRKAAKKSQKAIEKSGINDPEYMKAVARRGKQYAQAHDEEENRLEMNKDYPKSPHRPAGVEKAYLEGGFEGVDKTIQWKTNEQGLPYI